MCPCSHTLMSGSILFYKGLLHRPTGRRIPSGVARFGDSGRVHATVFASLHDLELVWQSHARLEASKPPERRCPSGPFVYFAHHDMADVAEEAGGQPPVSYCDCWPAGPGPSELIRSGDFDFRSHCESQPPPHLPTDAEARGIQWNELRAALSYENMVGLAYIHDPSRDPRHHLGEAEELRTAVTQAAAEALAANSCRTCGGNSTAPTEYGIRCEGAAAVDNPGQEPQRQPVCAGCGGGIGIGGGGSATVLSRRLEIFVFVLEQERGVNGHLLVEEEEDGEEGEGRREETEGDGANGDVGGVRVRPTGGVKRRGRAVTLEEYVVASEIWSRQPRSCGTSTGSMERTTTRTG
ncbi:hypothetical protein VOLCADRAFT_87025 [Volvox carteri f. nagariensis]|uniref:Uncharacterized protein n=1 Tax=Volvox carteri f. nagariensis TaxID=3068 RepID=D8TJZ4_VOLCA|nr:uncharacterized protein VOLCADRAFT_87025 [Volvox carteri f. nagariensis]EFJ51974.1 hypothetical protein VOLCADRAFT_87025 [Volvox carteri f. nagariensis]|eukprot:XP_002946748.1 hypothetical protein VOLCADRAFT_87025 [Volvox carteri f. nagariensis]